MQLSNGRFGSVPACRGRLWIFYLATCYAGSTGRVPPIAVIGKNYVEQECKNSAVTCCESDPKFMKYLPRLLLIFLLITTSACDVVDVQDMFVTRVTSVDKGELTNFRGGQVTCMHCPKYFSFDAKPQLVAKIIATHGLPQIASSTWETRQLKELVKREANWWEMADSNGRDKIYWISYKPKDVRLDSAVRLLVIKGKHAFFITSGHFDRELFKAGTSKPALP